nr:AbrB family transcriptional regulator [Azomonas agilis]
MIGSTFVCAWGVGALFEFPVFTLALGMMPGSSAEMYLTAEALHLGVGMVTVM